MSRCCVLLSTQKKITKRDDEDDNDFDEDGNGDDKDFDDALLYLITFIKGNGSVGGHLEDMRRSKLTFIKV